MSNLREALAGWQATYAAFTGAFDTPVERRKHSNEFTEDARRRLREFNEAVLTALSAQPHPEAVEVDQIQRAMDMLGDVPGNTILERVERIVSYYLALQCELEKVRAVPPIAPDERMRMALEKIASFNDTRANNVLAMTGSYGSFDEPTAVKIAREALYGAADASNASAEECDPCGEAEQWGMQYALSLFAKQIAGVEQWEGGDGSESVDGDVLAEFRNIAKAAGWVNADGDTVFGPSNASAEAREDWFKFLLCGRDDFIVSKGLWSDFVDYLRLRDAAGINPAGADEGKKSEGGEPNAERTQHRLAVSDDGLGPMQAIPREPPSGPSDPTDREINTPPDATAHREAIARIRNRIDSHLSDYLCDMKPNHDDSISGFNDAWDIVRKLFDDALQTRAGG